MKKGDVIKNILGDRLLQEPVHSSVHVYAPTNIALCKYWGKRDAELNLPMTSSLSISLANYGAEVLMQTIDAKSDEIFLNGKSVDSDSSFVKRLVVFLNLFRAERPQFFRIEIQSTVPIAAGLASSACGFASLVKALNEVYGWKLSLTELSILARLGSGSACRSLWEGFVEWHRGERLDGMDSHGEPLNVDWPEFQVRVLLVDTHEKTISSREAMQRTIETSGAYKSWPEEVKKDLFTIKDAILKKDFHQLGEAAELNAMKMHAMMLTANPPIQYSTPATLVMMQKIWNLRRDGLPVYFTQDAGPNLKLLFLRDSFPLIESEFDLY